VSLLVMQRACESHHNLVAGVVRPQHLLHFSNCERYHARQLRSEVHSAERQRQKKHLLRTSGCNQAF
jgi:hypothetical protein